MAIPLEKDVKEEEERLIHDDERADSISSVVVAEGITGGSEIAKLREAASGQDHKAHNDEASGDSTKYGLKGVDWGL